MYIQPCIFNVVIEIKLYSILFYSSMKIMLTIDILQSTCMDKLRCNEWICNKINELLFILRETISSLTLLNTKAEKCLVCRQ